MAQNNRTELGEDEQSDQIWKLLFDYLEKMDNIKPGPTTIFKARSSRIDLETKVWHHHHKIEAAGYHCSNIIGLSETVREDLTRIVSSDLGISIGTATEFRLALQDRRILFEVDAFFAALRSALDFLASVLSRYIRAKNTDKFRKIVEFLHDIPHPVAVIVNEAWTDWVKDCIDYRDYLLHRGVLPTPTGIHVRVTNPEETELAVSKFDKLIQREKGRPIVFPLPTKPNPAIRLTREDLLGLDKPELPMGVTEINTTITLSSGENEKGPTVRVSMGRSIGSKSVDTSFEHYLGKQTNEARFVSYTLAPGYVEADKLCQDLYKKLTDLSFKIFDQLIKVDFSHIA